MGSPQLIIGIILVLTLLLLVATQLHR